MDNTLVRLYRRVANAAAAILPSRAGIPVYGFPARCDVLPPPALVLKVAESQEEIESAFRLLHDAYVRAEFMRPDPSGLRVTVYNALPTTTTLIACYAGKVVGTVSLIRESLFGFPMQEVFNIDSIRAKGGGVAEVSGLALQQGLQAAADLVLFPLFKFVYEYSRKYVGLRHLVIAAHPDHMNFYESVLQFRRLKQSRVDHYDFVDGAPAFAGHLDLKAFPELMRRRYENQQPAKDLCRYFVKARMPNIVFPDKRFYTTNDPVMTPTLLDHFFNQRTRVFAKLSDQEKIWLHEAYDLAAYRKVLPALPEDSREEPGAALRHQRFSVACPARLRLGSGKSKQLYQAQVVQCSMNAFRARCDDALPVDVVGEAEIELGRSDKSVLRVLVQRKATRAENTYVIKVMEPDLAWRKFVSALRKAWIRSDLDAATRFLD